MKPFVLETPRLLIRQFTHEDLKDLQTILGNPEVMRFSVTGPLDKKRIEEYLKGTLSHYEKNGYGLWALGSTAIPNCEAKPIVDILGITNDVLQIDQFNCALEKANYIPLGEYGMKQRRFFRKKEPCSVNLHIFEDSDPEAARHLRFRDFLTTHPEEVRKYSQLKHQLATDDASDMAKYILGKESS